MRFLEGDVVETDSPEVVRLREEIALLKHELHHEKQVARQATTHAADAVSNLRRQLKPLYQALQQVFGEMETISTDDVVRDTGQWDEWKRRLGPSCAKVIDALVLGGEMSVKAIMTTAKMGQQTVYDATSKMGRAGILVRNGSKFSLKQL